MEGIAIAMDGTEKRGNCALRVKVTPAELDLIIAAAGPKGTVSGVVRVAVRRYLRELTVPKAGAAIDERPEEGLGSE